MTQMRLRRLSVAAVIVGISLGLFGSWLTQERPFEEQPVAPLLTQSR